MFQVDCSVVIPAYNASEHITDCLQSVVGHQTGFSFEIIVVDDGSQDATAAIVSTQFPSVRLFKKENGGPGSARNLGVEHAKSDLIVFIDADDIMLEGRLDHQVGFMLEHPEIKLTFGNQLHERTPEADLNRAYGWAAQESYEVIENAYARLVVKGSTVANTSTAVRRHAYLETGGQPEAYFVCEDYAMCCAIARKWPIAASCRNLTWYRQQDHGNLMGSSHTYEGPPRALYENLSQFSDALSEEELRQAKERLIGLVNMLVRYRYLYEGRAAAREVLRQYEAWLPTSFVLRWRLIISIAAPGLLRALRRLRHGGNVPHSYE
jgi:glycosyltransferase involved in cell wall biosynthesis